MTEKLIADIILAFPKYKEKLPVLEHMNVEGLQGILDIEVHKKRMYSRKAVEKWIASNQKTDR